MTEELRELMHTYTDRYAKLLSEYEESKESNDDEAMIISKALQKQCRIMTAELWHVMVKVGALDDEEIEFGSIKVKNNY